MEKEHQRELSKILGIEKGINNRKEPSSWAEIYIEIGRLKERAEKLPEQTTPFYQPPTPTYDSNLHYHNGTPCRNNPCTWC